MTVATRVIVWTAIVAALAAVVFATLPGVERAKPRLRPKPTEEPLPLIGEQNLLTQHPGGAPVTLGGVPMYNACALLPESDVAAAGLRIHRYVRAGSDHLSRDVDAPALLAGEGTETSSCLYVLEPPDEITETDEDDLSGYLHGWVGVTVQQAPFSDAGQYGLLKDRTEGYAEAGIQPSRSGGVLWYRDPASHLDADEPTFYLGEPDSGFVSEDYSRGERSFHEMGVVLGLHIDSSCTRMTAAKANRPWTSVGLTVTFEYFRDRPQAERTLISYCRSTDEKPDAVLVEHKIGAATCLFMEDELLFNIGRYNVWVEVDSARPITPAVLAERLVPLADKIADRLR